MRLSGLSQATFFYENVLNTQERKSNQNQQIKQKQANNNKKKWRQHVFEASKRGKIIYLGFFKKFEIVMITSFTILLKYILLNHSIESLFVRICFYLWSSVKISSFYENLFKSFLLAKIYSFVFFEHLFESLFYHHCGRICFLKSSWK